MKKILLLGCMPLFVLLTFVYIGFSLGDRASAAVFNLYPSLLAPQQTTNRDAVFPVVTGNKAYLVVGDGDYSLRQTGATVESPIADVYIKIEHGKHCNTRSAGSFTGVDSPLPLSSASTNFVVVSNSSQRLFTANNPTILTGNQTGCATTADLVTPLISLEAVTPGVYGALVGVQYNSTGSGQNSFNIVVVDGAGNEVPGAKVGFDKVIADKYVAALGQPPTTVLNLSITNTDQERYRLTDFNLPFTIPCENTRDNFMTVVSFHDIDEGIWQNVSMAGGTISIPSLGLVLERRLKGSGAWSTVNTWTLDNDHSDGTSGSAGSAESLSVNIGPFFKDNDYRVRVTDLFRANALAFSIDARDLVTGSSDPCVPPDICTNIPGNQATVPAPYTDPDGDQICDQPDSAPVITLTPVCNNVAGSYYINVATSDADGGTSTVSYGGTGFVAGSQASNSFNLPRDPTVAVTLSASTNGVYPTYYRSPQSGSAGPTTFPPCIYSFTLGASSSVPTLDDNEQPTNVNSVTFTTTYSSTSPNGVRVINSNKQMYVLKAGVLNLPYLIGPEIANVTFNVAAVDTRNNLSLVGRNLSAGDAVCSLYNINHTSGYVDTNGNLINNASYPLAGASGNTAQCQRIVNRPYLKVYGSDIMAGTGFGTNCTAATTNVIGSAKRLAAAPNNWVGAGTQLGVFANGFVDSFASSSILSPNLPSSKVFANNLTAGPAAVINNVFGGGYNSKFCDDDFWATKATSVTAAGGAIPALHALGSGQHQYNAGATINSAPIDLTSRIAIYVDGDITINTNIRMAATAAASPDSLPSFYVIVRGNIYITPGVTRLDGVYVAMPRNPATTLGTPADGGRIFTCADAGTAPSTATLTGPCITNKLTVNGSFSAVRINFLRGGGSLRSALAGELGTSANIAEVFNFLPESLLGIPAPSVTTLGQYDSVISLPPGL